MASSCFSVVIFKPLNGGKTKPLICTEFLSCNWSFLDGVLSLWREVAESGLMGEVLSSLYTKVETTLKGVELRSMKGALQESGMLPK